MSFWHFGPFQHGKGRKKLNQKNGEKWKKTSEIEKKEIVKLEQNQRERRLK